MYKVIDEKLIFFFFCYSIIKLGRIRKKLEVKLMIKRDDYLKKLFIICGMEK